MNPLLRIEGLVKDYPITRGAVLRRTVGRVRALDEVSLTIAEGETVGLVGESGSGKSTLARCVLRLIEPTWGQILFRGADVSPLPQRALRWYRKQVGIVFQDPRVSLNPRMSVEELIAEPLRFHGLASSAREARIRAYELLELVQLLPEHGRRYPVALSGGQQQRVAIARALASRPRLLVLDEPVSALDVTIRAQILDLLAALQRRLELSYLFITHDLSLVPLVCERVAVMNRGKIVEMGHSHEVFQKPGQPYTRSLLEAVPVPNPERERRARVARLQRRGLPTKEGWKR
ncbi:MAG TPA: ATP-binding cassette domain-containing protein [Actinomycetota bacterium]|nr:ATP-binding cassette domain-containing protein [Actinomycetota bacterium]